MINYGYFLINFWNILRVHFQEVGLMQILTNYVRVKSQKQLIWPLDESQGPSQLRSHGP